MRRKTGGTTRGIILAGVHSWGGCVLDRMGPRPLLPIAGRPLVWYGLEWLRRGGVSAASICANSDTDALRSCLERGASAELSLDYYEDVMPRGPAGCLRDAALHSDEETFVVLEGTILPWVDLESVLKTHRDFEAGLTVVVSESNADLSPVLRAGEAGRRELEPVGIYVASRAAIEHIPPKGYQDIKEGLVPWLHDRGCRIVPHIVRRGASLRIRDLDGYLAATAQVMDKLANEDGCETEYRRTKGGLVHKLAQAGHGLRLLGPVLIGPGVVIGDDVSIIGPAVVGARTQIESGSVLSCISAGCGCRFGNAAIAIRCIIPDGGSIGSGLVVREAVWPGAVRWA